ncbi:hypothetical protein FRX31_021103 [Thalictrum thalictroides]|uniref:Uncharacterized protein n=1 Tax=Thalictrum thalictroides TaxID=46969 RepID=A0A7J6VYQ6_THATH|nr:hypothetical protein FRX31_021103 [Thalictrum thalictroides]
MDVVAKGWQVECDGNPMLVLVNKLVNLKSSLRTWVVNTGSDLHKRVNEARCDLFKTQTLLQATPHDVQLAVQENQLLRKYGNLARAELATMKQRSDCEWMTMGDRGTRYFHSMVKERKRRNVIFSLQDDHGNTTTDQNQISAMIVKFYEELMGSKGDMEVDTTIIDDMTPRAVLTDHQVELLEREVMETLARKSVLFLWNGPIVSNKMHQAKLATVCLTIEEGGLGIKDMRKWNQTAYMGLVFMLA